MIAQIIQAFPDVFPDRLPLHLPKQRETDHRIDLVSDAKPPAHRIYRMSPLQDDALKKQLDAYIAAGHIVKTKLPFGAGLLFAKKKDGGLRLCIDYRQLNKLTEQDACPRFRIEQILDQRAQGQYFTKLDWQQGYHQIRMHPDHAKRTAFQTIFDAVWSRERSRYIPAHDRCTTANPSRLLSCVSGWHRHLEFFVGGSRLPRDYFRNSVTKRFMPNYQNAHLRKPKLITVGSSLEVEEYVLSQRRFKLSTIGSSPLTWKTSDCLLSMCGVPGFYQRFVVEYA